MGGRLFSVISKVRMATQIFCSLLSRSVVIQKLIAPLRSRVKSWTGLNFCEVHRYKFQEREVFQIATNDTEHCSDSILDVFDKLT